MLEKVIKQKLVVIGNGMAGIRTVEALLERAPDLYDITVFGSEKLWGGRRRSWHLHRSHELMEVAPWPKSMISAEA